MEASVEQTRPLLFANGSPHLRGQWGLSAIQAVQKRPGRRQLLEDLHEVLLHQILKELQTGVPVGPLSRCLISGVELVELLGVFL